MLQSVPKVVTYTRVSTRKQKESGLGLEAQDALLASYVAKTGARVVERFSEAKSGLKERPALRQAIAKAKATRSVLLVAKLDRVGRRASEVLSLLDRADVKIVFADTPHASDLQLGIMAVVAQEEARAISARTVAALAAARDRGVKLGGPKGTEALARYMDKHGNAAAVAGARQQANEFAAGMRSFVEPYVAQGKSCAEIAAALNADGIETRREGGRWHEASVRLLRKRLAI